jgi:hypothetical protein
MDSAVYNTKDGLATMLGSLDRLKALQVERRAAGYVRQERMEEFVLLGRFHLDTCGNFSFAAFDVLRPEAYAVVPPVLTKAEYEVFAKQYARPDLDSYVLESALPPPHAVCVACGIGWSLVDCHSAVRNTQVHSVQSLDAYAGRTLGEAAALIAATPGAEHGLNGWLVRSDRFIDHAQDNPEGWRDDEEGIGPDYVIQVGDEANVLITPFHHAECSERVAKNEAAMKEGDQKSDLTAALEESGFTSVQLAVASVPREFLDDLGILAMQPDDESRQEWIDMLPTLTWFRATTDQGAFSLGYLGISPLPVVYLKDSGVTMDDLPPGKRIDTGMPTTNLVFHLDEGDCLGLLYTAFKGKMAASPAKP